MVIRGTIGPGPVSPAEGGPESEGAVKPKDVGVQTAKQPRALVAKDLQHLRATYKEMGFIDRWFRASSEKTTFGSELTRIADETGISRAVLQQVVGDKSRTMTFRLSDEMTSRYTLGGALQALSRGNLTEDQRARLNEASEGWQKAKEALEAFKEEHGLDSDEISNRQEVQTTDLIRQLKKELPDGEKNFAELKLLLFEAEKSMGKAAETFLQIASEAGVHTGGHQYGLEQLQRQFSQHSRPPN